MSTNSFKVKKSVVLDPQAGSVVSEKGEIAYNTSTDKLESYNGAVDPIVTEAKAATLTNKSISGATNTITNVSLTSGVTGQLPTANGGTGQNSTATFPTSGVVVTEAAVETLTNKTLSGNTATNLVSGSGTFTFNTTGTITAPNATDTLVGKATTDVLTNKTLSGNTAATLISGAGTLTLNTSGTITVPSATDTLVGKATTDTLTNKTLGDAANYTQLTTPTTPASGFDKLYFKSDDNLYKLTSAGVETVIGSGSGGAINYILNPSAESATTGWATYADAAGNKPVDGTGGTATGLTFSRSTSSPLRGAASFLIAQANSTSLQGKGVSYDFTIDSADRAKVLSVSFDYNASSTFVTANGTTAPNNDGTTSTNAGNSDVEVFMYDVTNSILIPVSPQVIVANGTNNYSFKGVFQTASNSSSYRFILHCATTSANATGYSFKFDNVIVGPQSALEAAPITDPVAYTPTFTGFGTPSAVNFVSWREGAVLRVKGNFTSGTPTAVEGRISLGFNGAASNVTSVSTLPTLSYAGKMIVDKFWSIQNLSALIEPSVSYLTYGFNNTSSTGELSKKTGDSIVGGLGTIVSLDVSVPIAGWSSTSVMSNDTDTRVVAASYYSSANNTASTTQSANYDLKVYDTHAAVTAASAGTGTWKFTAPVSGYYRASAVVYLTTAVSPNLLIYKNGTLLQTAGPCSSQGVFACTFFLNAGDYFDQRLSSSAIQTGGTPGTSISSIQIERVSGPATIAATESVNCRYENRASTNLPNNATTAIPFATADYDSHGTFVGSTGIYTVPISGKYEITYSLYGLGATFAAGQEADVYLYKNGSQVQTHVDTMINTNSNYIRNRGTFNIACLAGDTLALRFLTNATSGSITLNNTAGYNYIAINRFGN